MLHLTDLRRKLPATPVGETEGARTALSLLTRPPAFFVGEGASTHALCLASKPDAIEATSDQLLDALEFESAGFQWVQRSQGS